MTSFLIALYFALAIFVPLDWQVAHLGFTSGPLNFGMLYRCLTYSFVHGGFGHFFFNSLLFFPAGLYVERKLGLKKSALLYVGGSAGSALFHMLLSIGNGGTMIGASGAVSAFMAAALLLLAQDGRKVAPLLLACLFLNDCNGTIYYTLGLTNVAHWGHIGGMLSAICLLPLMHARKR